MKNILIALVLVLGVSAVVSAQDKPWSSWDKKQIDKMLNDSPWGKTQTDTDTSQMTFTPTSDKQPLSTDGARNQSVDIKYRIRLFSAKPIRQAFARMVLMSNANLKPAQLASFVDGDYSETIIVAVAFESSDRRHLGPVEQKFAAATTDTLKNNVYLERGDGKKIFLDEYAKATSDGTGAKFVFPRLADGKAWVGPDDNLRFYADFGGGTKLTWRFKLSEMTYNGILEY